ncbi:hypothetical protein, partial [Pseudomonas aeruginosa]|uniref:hypothetical protein n=1 Tax=Pseudomonas aeruginosa TaxID=287 RepID=UPI0020CBB2FB
MGRKTDWPTNEKTFRTKRDAEDWARRTEDEMVRGVYSNRPPNPSPRFFQIAAWCAPIFGGHHFKPLS